MAGFKRVRIVMVFEADLDAVPGWGHRPDSWIDLAKREFERQSHYNTTAETISITEMDKVFVEGTGWVNPEFPKITVVPVE